MGLKLDNEFTVAVPLDRAWDALLDIRRVAACVPGATLEPGGEDGVHRGTMKVRLGPMTVAYAGTVQLVDADDDARVCTLSVKAKEQRGQGTVSATITNRLFESGDGTRVVVETDLGITGRQAQFGRGIMQDVATEMLGAFAGRLEHELLAAPEVSAPAVPAPASASTGVPAVRHDDDGGVLDVGDVLRGPLVRRAGLAAAGAAAVCGLLLTVARLRARRGVEVTVRFRQAR
jgi:uncharacterized protein